MNFSARECSLAGRLFVSFLLLLTVGFVSFYSASYYISCRILDSPHGFFLRQLLWATTGGVFFVLVCYLPLKYLRLALPYCFFLLLFLMLITILSPLGQSLQGARRWIFIGNLSIQPSELVKIFLVVYLAHFFSKYQEKKLGLRFWLVPLTVVLLFLILTVAQNDYSTTFFMAVVVFSIMWIAYLPYRYMFTALLALAPLFIWTLFTQPYRVARLMAFLNPLEDLTGAGYQYVMARKAIQNGGFFGMGLGESLQKMGRLPEAYADYIFAIFAEEFGLLGVTAVIGLFSWSAFLGYKLSLQQKDLFLHYLTFGLTTLIFMQFIFNLAIVSGLMPSTGIPLPFFSSGGSHLVVSMCSYGLLINVAKAVSSKTKQTIGA